MRTSAATVTALALTLTACADTAPDTTEPATDTVDLTDAAADSIQQLRVRADGMTIWAEPRVLSERTWLFQGRSSHTLAGIEASVDGETARDAKLVSARKFEVRLTAQQMEDNLGERPLLIDLTTASGAEYTVMMVARARFVETTGSTKLYPWRNIEPILVGRDRVFRARVTTPENIVFVGGWNDDDSEPIVSREDATHWMLDWYPGMLAWAAHPTEDALDLVADDSDGNRYRRDAPIHMEIVRLGVTNQDPNEVWRAPTCTARVRSCVANFDVERDDLEACGSAAEVAPCLDEVPEDDTEDWIQQFAGDFRRHLIDYYATREADIVAAGGNTRPQALVSVDSADIVEVLDGDDVPSGHSLDTHRVFTHPDVTFPGSDIVWFGVYERATGDLVEIYDFN